MASSKIAVVTGSKYIIFNLEFYNNTTNLSP